MPMTGKMNASMPWTARCLSAADTAPSAPRRAAWCPSRGCPQRFWAAGPAARRLLITVPGSTEDYIAEVNTASSHAKRSAIGESDGIRVMPR